MGGLGRFTRWTLSACRVAVLLVSLAGRESVVVQGMPTWRTVALDLVIQGGFSVSEVFGHLSVPGQKYRFCAKNVYRWIKRWELYATSTS
jgi:nitric oxide reductase large subunit